MGARAFEGLKLRNGLLRELGPVQVRKVAPGFNKAWVPGRG